MCPLTRFRRVASIDARLPSNFEELRRRNYSFASRPINLVSLTVRISVDEIQTLFVTAIPATMLLSNRKLEWTKCARASLDTRLKRRFKRCQFHLQSTDVTVTCSHQSHICQKQATTFPWHLADFLAAAESLTNKLACINFREDKRYSARLPGVKRSGDSEPCVKRSCASKRVFARR